MKREGTLCNAIAPSAAARREDETLTGLGARGARAPEIYTPGVITARAGVLEGSHAGDYILDNVIGSGGFGVVYRASHAARGTPAAIKIVHPELVSRPDVLLRFQREIEAIRRIRHPGVVDILDFGWLDDGRPYFAMELLAGRTLEQHLAARGRLPPEEALALLDPLCAALAAAHARGIIHRDIKPSNVFLCRESEGRRVVLLDFGIAKLLDAPGPALTSSRHVVGTPGYISPEQILNQPVDARTDVYALGALLYSILTDAPPFQEGAYPTLRELHLHATPPRPSARAPVSPAFDAVVVRAMSKDPAARHPDVGAFLAAALAAETRHAGAAQVGLRGRRALGLHVEVTADADALEAPAQSLLEDFESILPRAIRELSAAGFLSAAETGRSVLLAAPLPDDARRGEEARRGAVSAAVSLHRRLAARAGRDGRVHVRLCVHAGEIVAEGDGALVGGDLLDLPTWVPEEVDDGVFASPAILRGLGVATQPCPPAGRHAVPLLRVLDLPPRGSA